MFGDDDGDETDLGPPIPSVDVPGEDEEESEQTEGVPFVDAPEQSVPNVDVPDGEDAPEELKRAFWTLVAVADAALLAFGVGVLFIVFRGEVAVGASLLVAAAGLGFYARERYRTATETDWEAKDA